MNAREHQNIAILLLTVLVFLVYYMDKYNDLRTCRMAIRRATPAAAHTSWELLVLNIGAAIVFNLLVIWGIAWIQHLIEPLLIAGGIRI